MTHRYRLTSSSPSRLPVLGAVSLLVLLAGCMQGTRTTQVPDPGSFERLGEQIVAVPNPEDPRTQRGPRYDKPDEAQAFFVSQRVAAGQAIPGERYDKARANMAKMARFGFVPTSLGPQKADISPMSAWSYLGPNNAGGRSRAIAIRTDDPSVMFAAGVAGGVFRSNNAGASWAPVDDGMQNLAVVSIEIAPSNQNVMYAGTGEGYFNADAVRGDGIFKSIDGGVTWVKLASTDRTLNATWRYVYAIRVHPSNPDVLWASTINGVWRSADGGGSWTRVLNQNYCLDLEFNFSANAALASCGTLNLQGRIYRSSDGGLSFGATPVLEEPEQSRTEIAVSKSSPNVFYAAAINYVSGAPANYGFKALWISTDSGASWTQRAAKDDANEFHTALLGDFDSACDGDPRNQGWYDFELAVDPVNPDIVWIGGIDIYRSDDGGVNFARAGVWYADGNQSYGVHADQHRFVFHPGFNGTSNQTMYVGNDGGIYRTDNSRAAIPTYPTANCTNTPAPGVAWIELTNGFGVTQFYHGVVHDGAFMGGTQDNGTWLGDDVPDNWDEIAGGDGGYAAIDRDEGLNRFYTSFQNGSFLRWIYQFNNYQVLSGNNGLADDGLAFITPLAMDPNNPKTLWTGGSRLWRTTDGMANWQVASLPDTASEVSALAVAPGNSNLVLVGTNDGTVLRNTSATTAGAATAWSAVNVAPGGYISEISFDPSVAGRAYLTQSRFGQAHVYRSNDSGATWTAIDKFGVSGGIPDLPAHSIAVDPDDPQRLYVGTDLGMFVTVNGASTWAVADSPLPNTVVEKLEFVKDGANRQLVAFTHGRGAWRADAGVVQPTRFADVPQNYWAYVEIERLAAAGITGGCATAPLRYCPTAPVTRDQMAVFLLRAREGSAYNPPNATGVFSDVPLNFWSVRWIEKLRADGITGGCGTNPLRYCPTSPVTRDQMAIFLLKTKYGSAYQPPAPTGIFEDVPLNYWAAAWIEQLANEGIAGGCSVTPKRYCPTSAVSRDQMAVFLVRTFDP